MEQVMAVPMLSDKEFIGTGGFLNPDKIVEEFNIKQGMSVADFGCGAGYFTILLAQKVGNEGKVYALDILENSLDSVNARARAKNIENIETIRTNLEVVGNSRIASNSQDMVLMANILFQSNSEKEKIFEEAIRILKTGGTVIVIDWEKGSGGFGPPDSIRTDANDMKKLSESVGFKFERNLDAGKFHYGLVFIK